MNPAGSASPARTASWCLEGHLHGITRPEGGLHDSPGALGEALLRDLRAPTASREPRIERAGDATAVAAYHALRHREFVLTQGLFPGSDRDDVDDDPRTVVLVARVDGAVVGGVRLAPATPDDVGWWRGSRLVVSDAGRGAGPALVRAACAHAEAAGALRFDATVQARHAGLFTRLGWTTVRPVELETPGTAVPHVLMRWPIGRVAALVAATKRDLGELLAPFADAPFAEAPGPPGSEGPVPHGPGVAGPVSAGLGVAGLGLAGLGGPGFVGDDGAPVPGSDLVAACDAILPSMVERDPEWAGWCAVLVNVNDLAAMGASPVGLLDALGARDRSFAARVLAGLRHASQAYGVPVLGGHTQLGVPAALSVTALGRTAHPVPGGGGRPGQHVRLTADLAGGWRPGYAGRQWDSTTARRTPELRAMLDAVGHTRPAAAKDVSMAGVVGTLGMLAEASGCGAVLEVAAVPRPAGVTAGDWLTCFPGFAMLTADDPGAPPLPAGPAVGAVCGELVAGQGVALRWPDGELTEAVGGGVTGLGPA